MGSETIEIGKLIEGLNAPAPYVVGLEGGPCSGKTTVLTALGREALVHETALVLLPEAASKHIARIKSLGRGVIELATADRPAYLELQADILRDTLSAIDSAKREYAGEDAVIVADRVDIGAYLSKAEYRGIYESLGYRQPPYLTVADKIVYLETLARDEPELYLSLSASNPERYETSVEQAVATCARNLESVSSHPELTFVSTASAEAKQNKVAAEVFDPELEVEVKFKAHQYMEYEWVQRYLDSRCQTALGAIDIKQSYHRHSGGEYRLRRIATNRGAPIYHYAVKSEGEKRRERRRTINRETYAVLYAHGRLGELSKRRYRYLFEPFVGSRTMTVLAADFYAKRHLCTLEVEGIGPQLADRIYLSNIGFSRSNMSARDLIE